MKGLACSNCVFLRTFPQNDFEPVFCDCGISVGWWTNGKEGEARYASTNPPYTQGVGFNNRFLMESLGVTNANNHRTSEWWRDLHESQGHAPGYLFDKSNRDCWVVFFKPGSVNQVQWANEAEQKRVELPVRFWDLMSGYFPQLEGERE